MQDVYDDLATIVVDGSCMAKYFLYWFEVYDKSPQLNTYFSVECKINHIYK